jgi:hypothetical protein
MFILCNIKKENAVKTKLETIISWGKMSPRPETRSCFFRIFFFQPLQLLYIKGKYHHLMNNPSFQKHNQPLLHTQRRHELIYIQTPLRPSPTHSPVVSPVVSTPCPKPSPQSPLPTLAAGGGATQPTLLRCTLLDARPLVLHPARPGAPLPRF